MKPFTDIRELDLWLNINGINTATWGVRGTKTVRNLWGEYVSGEIAFEAPPPLRIVQVVQVIIRRGNRVLLEIEQEFGNAQKRSRHQPPSEKMKAGESYILAAIRCLQEELGLARDDIAFVGSGYEKVEMLTESPSYPGLQTKYTFHSIEAVAKGLPEKDFWRENITQMATDPVKRHLWAWQTRLGSGFGALQQIAR